MVKPATGPGGPHRRGSKMRRLPRGQTRLHWTTADRRGAAKLHVPAALARLIGSDRIFQVELTEEGILFRYVEGGKPVVLPAWLTDSD